MNPNTIAGLLVTICIVLSIWCWSDVLSTKPRDRKQSCNHKDCP